MALESFKKSKVFSKLRTSFFNDLDETIRVKMITRFFENLKIKADFHKRKIGRKIVSHTQVAPRLKTYQKTLYDRNSIRVQDNTCKFKFKLCSSRESQFRNI